MLCKCEGQVFAAGAFKKSVAPAVVATPTPSAIVVSDLDSVVKRQQRAMETMHYYIAGTPFHLVPKRGVAPSPAPALLMFTPGDDAVDTYFGRIVLSKYIFSDHFCAASLATLDSVLEATGSAMATRTQLKLPNAR